MAVDQFETISLRDQAIDWDAIPSDVIWQYVETRDVALIKPFVKAGERPLIYVLREIPNELADDYVLGADNEPDLNKPGVYRRAFKAALVRVLHLRVRDGVLLPEFEPAKSPNGIVRDAELGRFDQFQRLEVGTVAIQRGFFPPGTEPIFRLPPFLVQLWAHPMHRTVEPKSALPAESSEPVSSAAQAPTASITTELKP